MAFLIWSSQNLRVLYVRLRHFESYWASLVEKNIIQIAGQWHHIESKYSLMFTIFICRSFLIWRNHLMLKSSSFELWVVIYHILQFHCFEYTLIRPYLTDEYRNFKNWELHYNSSKRMSQPAWKILGSVVWLLMFYFFTRWSNPSIVSILKPVLFLNFILFILVASGGFSRNQGCWLSQGWDKRWEIGGRTSASERWRNEKLNYVSCHYFCYKSQVLSWRGSISMNILVACILLGKFGRDANLFWRQDESINLKNLLRLYIF